MPKPELMWRTGPGNRVCTAEAWARNFVGEERNFFRLYWKPIAVGLPVPFPSSPWASQHWLLAYRLTLTSVARTHGCSAQPIRQVPN